ncbi:MAG: class I SAM-dependent methyltransferase [Acidiferrobacterales bacterium]
MEIEAIRTAYRRYARIYDSVFGPILNPGRKLIIQALKCQPGDNILEVGVGTGLSLPLYPKDVKVTGIDISGEMLAKARERVTKKGLSQVTEVLEMDAENLRFADNSFDKLVAMYVVSVVSNPTRLVEEMRRVCRPGGEIFIANHFRAHNPIIRALEGLVSPLAKLVGFHPDLALEDLLAKTRLDVIDTSSANLFGYWKVLRCRSTARRSLALEPDEPIGHQSPGSTLEEFSK